MLASISELTLMAFVGALAGVLGVYDADMRLEPITGVSELNEVFKVEVVVQADTPVNVFQGNITFDSAYLSVDSIEYNNSLADLWAVKPWYSNGEGTINFAGGTTKQGGFIGTDTLLTVYLRTKQTGNAQVRFTETQILKYDGLGSDASVVEPIDALFTISNDETQRLRVNTGSSVDVNIVTDITSTDLNGDGEHNFVDFGLFISDLTSQNLRSDFDGNNKVDFTDMNIILNTKL